MEKEFGHIFCEHCGAFIKKSKYLIHLYKVHDVRSYPDEEYIKKKIEIDRVEIEKREREIKFKSEINSREKKISENNRAQRRKERKQREEFLKCLIVKYASFTKALAEINNSLYNKKIEELTKSLIEKLEIEKQKIDNITEVSRINEYQNEFSLILENKRTKKDDFVSNECKSYYITWSDVTFNQNKVHLFDLPFRFNSPMNFVENQPWFI
jgi:hypothetical protein